MSAPGQSGTAERADATEARRRAAPDFARKPTNPGRRGDTRCGRSLPARINGGYFGPVSRRCVRRIARINAFALRAMGFDMTTNQSNFASKLGFGALAFFLILNARAATADLPATARQFINTRCIDCHDADSKKGGLDLSLLAVRLDDPALEAKWTYIFDRVERGEMPPKKKVPPIERAGFLQSLGEILAAHDAERQKLTGRVVLRRLNRAEYENTVHDLLAIGTPLADMLPDDATAFGFDNVAEALRLSSAQIESYLAAADKALDAALDLRADPRIRKRISLLDLPNVRDMLNKPHGSVNSDGTKYERLIGAKGDAFLLFENETFGITTLRESRAPIAGLYKVRISAFAHQATGHPVVVARLMATNFSSSRLVGAFDLEPGKTRVAETTTWLEENELIYLSANGCPGKAADGTNLHEVGAENYSGPGVGVHWIEIDGPLVTSWPPISVSRVFADVPVKPLAKPNRKAAFEIVSTDPSGDAGRVVLKFATRAFRRPVTQNSIARYTQLATDALANGATFENAIRRACKAILSSPEFLFLQEQPGRLDDYGLAARLSYFLWSTTPDDELLKLAAEGKLKKPMVLRAQTDRLLADPRSRALVKNFCGQWLNLRAINATTPERDLYPDFDLLLRDSMIGETESFFAEMLRDDLGAATLIDSDFAMLNRRLAEHYGIAGVVGEQFRKVTLPPNSHRGGVLTQASILKVTANGSLSSPVVRGTWVMKRILGRQPQPPPADAGSIEPDTRGATTIREQLAKHRRMASCSACHQYMDPPGFALENYDVIGGWREWYRSQKLGDGVMKLNPCTDEKMYFHRGPSVDASGALADGAKFENIDGLKKLLLEQREAVARNLVNNLLTYATGAGVTFADRAQVQGILDRAKSHAYGLRSLVEEVAQSDAFAEK